MTDRQIYEIILHKRNKDGAIELPEDVIPELPEDESEATLESELQSLNQMAQGLRIPPQMVEQAVEKLKAKYAEKPNGKPAR